MFVLSSPSGAGKTTIARELMAQDSMLEMSVSATTRPPRPGEVDGQDYLFLDETTFAQMAMNQEFLEHAHVFDYHYGTPRTTVHAALEEGKDVLFDIDWQGTRQLKQTARRDLVSVFILPPSLEALEMRLRNRAQDSEEVVKRRMAKATGEISHWDEYDYVIINRDIAEATRQVAAILEAERHRRKRQSGLAGFVAGLTPPKAGI